MTKKQPGYVTAYLSSVPKTNKTVLEEKKGIAPDSIDPDGKKDIEVKE